VKQRKLAGKRPLYNLYVRPTATLQDLAELPGSSTGPLAPARDRLTTTLFLAALFHGIVILGVTFGLPDSNDGGIPTMEVLLLSDPGANDELNPEAAYLAQRNQRGSGTTQAEVRPGSPATSLLPANLAGLPNGNGIEWQQALLGAPAIDLVASRSNRSDPSVRHGTGTPSRAAETPLALLYMPPSPVIATSIDKSLVLRGKIVHEVEVAPNTRESRIAPYLDAWKRKVERLGTVKFPMAARDLLRQGAAQRNPVLEVVIRSDGSIDQIVVRRSSGLKELDQAALGILKLASPFDAFSPELKEDFDQLRFAYEWQFIGDRLRGTVTAAP
jgi:protein TonB